MNTTKLIPAFAALLFFTAPHAALAQKQPDDTPPVAFGDNADKDEDAAPPAFRTYAPINYDPAVEDRKSVV